MKKTLLSIAVALALAIANVTCGGGGGGKEQDPPKEKIPVTAVDLAPSEPQTILAGQTFTLVATVRPVNADNRAVNWASSSPDIVTLSPSGDQCIVTGAASGTTSVTVMTAAANFQQSCQVTVIVPVAEVTLNKTATDLPVGRFDTLLATVLPAGATDKGVTWTSSAPAIATVEGGGTNGVVTAHAAGAATITASAANGLKRAECVVRVVVPVESVSLIKPATTLVLLDQEQLAFAIQPSDATNQGVSWTSSNNAIATVTSGGLVRGINIGEADITVTTLDGGKKDTCTVTVAPESFTAVAAGQGHALAIRVDGTLWAWGGNGSGQLGDGTNIHRYSPVKVANGSKGWAAVSAGDYHTVGLKTDGTIWAWGRNNYGQLGDGTTVNKSTPVQVGTAKDWTAVSAGEYHTVALKANGSLWAWGNNEYGQLGNGTLENKNAPFQVTDVTDWAAVSAGDSHNVALGKDGSLWAWGDNWYGQIGDGTNGDSTGTNKGRRYPTPVRVGSSRAWAELSAGGNHTIATRTDGSLWAWGRNEYGQLGDGTYADKNAPIQVNLARAWAAPSAAYSHTVALMADGTLCWAWGRNEYGQLGDDTYVDKNAPVQVGSTKGWAALAAGTSHTLALKTDGTVWAWGYNGLGQLGDGTTISRKVPAQVVFGGAASQAFSGQR